MLNVCPTNDLPSLVVSQSIYNTKRRCVWKSNWRTFAEVEINWIPEFCGKELPMAALVELGRGMSALPSRSVTLLKATRSA